MIEVSDIKSNPDNPRIIKDDKFIKLVNSIKEFPKMMALRPMVVDSNMMVLGGNMRLKAIKEAGFKEIPDNWVKSASDLTEDEKKRFIITDNVSGGEWDWDDLANNWDVDELTAWGLDVVNYSAGVDENNMNDDDVDLTEEFDPIGIAKNLHKIIFIFDNEEHAIEFYKKNNLKYQYKVMNGGTGGDSKIWQINLSDNYGK
jgi:hypothetical protein